MSGGWTLVLTQAPSLRVDLSGVLPGRLAALDAAGVAALPLRHGNETLALGELFRVAPHGAAATLVLEGDLSRFDRVGAGMDGGALRAEGPVGDALGERMQAGTLAVAGSARDLVGCEMTGGRLEVHGDVGDCAASALPGDLDGMRGGTLVVRGRAGDRFADRMRRGLALVHGDAGDFMASRLVAGTIAIGGRCGRHPGYGMRRGTVVFAGAPPPLPPTFSPTTHDLRVWWTLLARDLEREGGAFAGLAARRPARHVGDAAVGGKGEWLVV
jgi:formylmethanofuran dehydrogenase subunit C